MPISDKRITLIGEYRKSHSENETAECFAISLSSTRRVIRRYKALYGIDPTDVNAANQIQADKELLEIRKHLTAQEIRTLLRSAKGYKDKEPEIVDFTGDQFTFGLIGDTHFGSLYFQLNWYESALREFDKQNVDFIIHVGDICEGMSNRAGHIYECSHIGYDAQKQYAIEQLSKTDKMIYGITGNHDDWFIKSNGAYIGKDLERAVGNFTYLGSGEGKLKIGTIEIMPWHGLDGNCFDDETEILTEDGFILFNQLDKSMKVGTMTKDKHIFEWQFPTEITDEYYSGDMYHFKSRTVDCLATPKHGMWTRANKSIAQLKNNLLFPMKSHIRNNYDWHRKTAEEIYNNWRKQKWQFTTKVEGYNNTLSDEFVDIPFKQSQDKGVNVRHFRSVPMKQIAELIAWYVTEGRNNKNIVLGSMEMVNYLYKECGHLSKNKYLPRWLKNQNRNILQLVFDTMIRGDGWRNGKSYGYKSISRKLRNDFAEIAIKLGYGVNFNKDTVMVKTIQNYPSTVKKPTIIKYNGRIYCCSVPNGLICVRRNGRVMWTHNSYATSYRIQKLIESFYGDEKPHLLLCGHVHKQGYFFDRNVHAYSAATLQKQTPWMRGKRLQAHTGFWKIDVTFNEIGVVLTNSTFYPFYK